MPGLKAEQKIKPSCFITGFHIFISFQGVCTECSSFGFVNVVMVVAFANSKVEDLRLVLISPLPSALTCRSLDCFGPIAQFNS